MEINSKSSIEEIIPWVDEIWDNAQIFADSEITSFLIRLQEAQALLDGVSSKAVLERKIMELCDVIMGTKESLASVSVSRFKVPALDILENSTEIAKTVVDILKFEGEIILPTVDFVSRDKGIIENVRNLLYFSFARISQIQWYQSILLLARHDFDLIQYFGDFTRMDSFQGFKKSNGPIIADYFSTYLFEKVNLFPSIRISNTGLLIEVCKKEKQGIFGGDRGKRPVCVLKALEKFKIIEINRSSISKKELYRFSQAYLDNRGKVGAFNDAMRKFDSEDVKMMDAYRKVSIEIQDRISMSSHRSSKV